MSMIEAVKSVFSKYATFQGRSRRREYWMFFLFNAVIMLTIKIIMQIFALKDGVTFYSMVSEGGSERFNIIEFIFELYMLATIIPGLAVCCRRLHDTGKSGAYILLCLTGIGVILVVIWLMKDSDSGENKYGPNPKTSTHELSKKLYSNREEKAYNPTGSKNQNSIQEVKLYAPLSDSCPSCGWTNKANVSFCVHCGTPMNQSCKPSICRNSH